MTKDTTVSFVRAILRSCTIVLCLGVHGVCGAQPLPPNVQSAQPLESLWAGSAEAAQRRQLALERLANAENDGLDPRDYIVSGAPSRDPIAAATYDRELTDAVLRYAHDLRVGRLEASQVYDDAELPRQRFDAAAALNAAMRTGTLDDFFGSLEPPHPEYRQLKNALAKYRGLAATSTPAPAQFATESRSPSGGSSISRVMQIVANMERWRWVPRDFGPNYIAVNAADTTLVAVSGGKTVLTSRIIAGKQSTPTPMFEAAVTAVTANPYWNVPPSIARNELMPKERKHPGYLARHHFFWDDGDLRQRPGKDNALGRVKLEMANRFNSYLHDTPTKKLFARSDRHLSHGCMRTEQILPLASFALAGDTESGLGQIQSAIDSGVNRKIPISSSIPVYVLYWTAVAREDGSVDFHDDIYGRDSTLIAALAGRAKVERVAQVAPHVTECQRATG
jgi:L,D-transpeptidase YcbB